MTNPKKNSDQILNYDLCVRQENSTIRFIGLLINKVESGLDIDAKLRFDSTTIYLL